MSEYPKQLKLPDGGICEVNDATDEATMRSQGCTDLTAADAKAGRAEAKADAAEARADAKEAKSDAKDRARADRER